MLKHDILKKAIMIECNALLGHQKGGVDMKPDTLNDVTSFYIQLREIYKHEISYSDIVKDHSWNDQLEQERKIQTWATKNDIFMFRVSRDEIYYFSSAEDAIAFKLKWL